MEAKFVMNEEQILKKRKAAEYKKLMAIVPNELEENESDTIKKILQNYKTNLNAEILPERVQYHAEFFVEKFVFGKTAEDYLLLQLNPKEEHFYFNKMRFRHLIELANIQFYGIINFIKNIPEFDLFETETQVRIIRSCTVEVFLVNLALFYDETRDVITIGNSSYPLSSMAEVGISENGLQEFRTILLALDKMQLTERESSLLIATMIFSEDRGSNEHQLFEIQEHYALLLQKTLDERKLKKVKNRFPELIFLLSSVRRISTRLRPYLQAFTCQYPDFIPPLIKEIND